MKVYFLQLTLTKSCNQSCYYCDVFKHKKDVEVDVDFLRYILDNHPQNTFVEISGGETGLVKNLDEVFKVTKDHRNVVGIQLMSNGLVRKLGYDWLKHIVYNEHLVFDIEGKDVKKFYPMDFVDYPNSHTVIVTTEKTTKSLLENWDYFNFDKDKFWFKLMNPKTHTFKDYTHELIKLFEIIEDQNSINMVKYSMGMMSFEFQRGLCSKYPPQPAVDFETKELVHCATKLMKSQRSRVGKDNIQLNIKGKLFKNFSSCKNCFTFDMCATKFEDVLESTRGSPVNRRIK